MSENFYTLIFVWRGPLSVIQQDFLHKATTLFCVFLSLPLSAPVRYVFRCEEQVSAAPGMSRHGGLSSEQRQ